MTIKAPAAFSDVFPVSGYGSTVSPGKRSTASATSAWTVSAQRPPTDELGTLEWNSNLAGGILGLRHLKYMASGTCYDLAPALLWPQASKVQPG